MYTQCPECLTIYELDAETLAQAHGAAACGQCGATFNALSTLAAELPEEPFQSLPAHASSPTPPLLMMAVIRESTPPHSLREAAATTIGEPLAEGRPDAAAEAPDTGEPPLPFPSFARRARTHSTVRRRWPWALACLLLAVCAATQLGWAERRPLAANPLTRPWLTRTCHVLGCTLPRVRDPARLQLLSREVRPHPTVPHALLISATIRNNAGFTQPYPIVSITLSDLDQNRVAMRRFRPAEYIPDPRVRAAGLAPGASAALMFEVADPGRDAVAFRFAFQ